MQSKLRGEMGSYPISNTSWRTSRQFTEFGVTVCSVVIGCHRRGRSWALPKRLRPLVHAGTKCHESAMHLLHFRSCTEECPSLQHFGLSCRSRLPVSSTLSEPSASKCRSTNLVVNNNGTNPVAEGEAINWEWSRSRQRSGNPCRRHG
jgi:hypothetical protein